MATKILLIDDDVELCDELAELLKETGLQVECAHSGITGLEMIYQYTYNLILLDLKIPGKSGWEVLKEIKSYKSAPKVFVITGKPLNKNQNPGAELDAESLYIIQNADGIFNKPYDIDKLLNEINRIHQP